MWKGVSNGMRTGRLRRLTLVSAPMLGGVLLALAASGRPDAPPKVDFAHDIEPVLKAHCYQCHGGDQKQGGLRLDGRAQMLQGGASGAAVVAGSAGKSLLVERLLGQGGKTRMPLGFAPLTEAQI